MYRFGAAGDERDDPESEMLRLPSPLPPPPPLPLPRADDFNPLGVDGACLLVDPEEDGGGVPDLPAFANRAAFWLFFPNGDSEAAEDRFGAVDGMLERL